MRKITLALILSLALTPFTGLFSQESVLDSLLNIPFSVRDSAWCANTATAAYKTVYAKPEYAKEAIMEARNVAKSIKAIDMLPRIYLIRAVVEDVQSHPDSALFYNREALKVARVVKDTSAQAGAYNNIGLVYWGLHHHDSALVNYAESERLFTAIEGKSGLMSTMNNMGLIYQGMYRLEPAMEYFRRLLKVSQKENSPYFESVAYTNIANTFARQKQDDSAMVYTRLAIPIQEEENNLWGLAKSHYNLGIALEGLYKYEEARAELEKSLEIQRGLDNREAMAEILWHIAYGYRRTGDDDNYMKYIMQAKDLMSDGSDIELKTDIDASLALQRVRKYEPELYSELIRTGNIRDSIHNAEVDGRILELQEAYETEKRKQEIATQSLEIEAERRRNKAQLQIGLLLGALALTTISALIFFVIYRRKRAALEKQKALHDERLRISKDLHDNVGARLTSIALRSDLLGQKLEPSTRAAPEFSRLTEEAGETVGVLRDTIWAINQDQFTVADFSQRISTYGKRILPEGIQFYVNQEVASDHILQSLEALNLFRVVQEALQNTMKHADADRVEVNVKADHTNLILDISDNGKGSDGELDPDEDHYGLQNMKARISEIGGNISFFSGEGFTVKVRLPKNA